MLKTVSIQAGNGEPFPRMTEVESMLTSTKWIQRIFLISKITQIDKNDILYFSIPLPLLPTAPSHMESDFKVSTSYFNTFQVNESNGL